MSVKNGFNEYGRIRQVLTKIYLYGFYGRAEFSDEGIVKTYDDVLAYLKPVCYLPDQPNAVSDKNKKSYKIDREYYRRNEELLANTYRLYSVNLTEEALRTVTVLAALADGEEKTFDDIFACLPEISIENEDDDASDDDFDDNPEKKLRYTVKQMVNDGLVLKKGTRYTLFPNLFDVFSKQDTLWNTEIFRFYDYLKFAQVAFMPKIPCSNLLRAARREIARLHDLPGRYADPLFSADFEGMETDTALVRRGNPRSICDEDIAYELMKAITERRSVILIFDKKSYKKGEPLQQPNVRFLPTGLRADYCFGRWYAEGIQDDRPQFVKLSNFEEVEIIRDEEPTDAALWDRARKLTEDTYARSLASTDRSRGGHISAEVTDAMTAQGILARELRLGRLTQAESGAYRYDADVNDYWEAVPLLRSYAHRIRIEPGETGIREHIARDLMTMKQSLIAAMTEPEQEER